MIAATPVRTGQLTLRHHLYAPFEAIAYVTIEYAVFHVECLRHDPAGVEISVRAVAVESFNVLGRDENDAPIELTREQIDGAAWILDQVKAEVEFYPEDAQKGRACGSECGGNMKFTVRYSERQVRSVEVEAEDETAARAEFHSRHNRDGTLAVLSVSKDAPRPVSDARSVTRAGLPPI